MKWNLALFHIIVINYYSNLYFSLIINHIVWHNHTIHKNNQFMFFLLSFELQINQSLCYKTFNCVFDLYHRLIMKKIFFWRTLPNPHSRSGIWWSPWCSNQIIPIKSIRKMLFKSRSHYFFKAQNSLRKNPI